MRTCMAIASMMLLFGMTAHVNAEVATRSRSRVRQVSNCEPIDQGYADCGGYGGCGCGCVGGCGSGCGSCGCSCASGGGLFNLFGLFGGGCCCKCTLGQSTCVSYPRCMKFVSPCVDTCTSPCCQTIFGEMACDLRNLFAGLRCRQGSCCPRNPVGFRSGSCSSFQQLLTPRGGLFGRRRGCGCTCEPACGCEVCGCEPACGCEVAGCGCGCVTTCEPACGCECTCEPACGCEGCGSGICCEPTCGCGTGCGCGCGGGAICEPGCGCECYCEPGCGCECYCEPGCGCEVCGCGCGAGGDCHAGDACHNNPYWDESHQGGAIDAYQQTPNDAAKETAPLPPPASSARSNAIRRGARIEYGRPQRTLKYYSSHDDRGTSRYISSTEYASQQHARAVMARRAAPESIARGSQVASRQVRATSRAPYIPNAPRTATRSDSGIERMSYQSPRSSSVRGTMTRKLQRQHEEILRHDVRFFNGRTRKHSRTGESDEFSRFFDQENEE